MLMTPRLSWRCGFLLLACVSVGLMLAASSESRLAFAAPSSSAPQANPPRDGRFPVAIRHQFGTTIIPKPPQRVIVLEDDEYVVSLGLRPIAIARNPFSQTGMTSWLAKALGSHVPVLLDVQSGYPFEQIAALKPDLIIGGVTQSNYELLSKIAPTIDYLHPNLDTWQQRTLTIGKALGRNTAAQALVKSISAKIAASGKKHLVLTGKTFSLSLDYAPGTVSAIRLPTEASVRFLNALGMVLSPRSQALPATSADGRSDVSFENLDVLDADVVIMAHVSSDLQKALESSPVFQSLPAVQRHSYVALDLFNLLALARPSPMNIPYLLTWVVRALSRAASHT